MRAWLYKHWETIGTVAFVIVLAVAMFFLTGCDTIKSAGIVGAGSSAGAIGGFAVAGPPGAAIGAFVGGVVGGLFDRAVRATELENRLSLPNAIPPLSEPWWTFGWVPLWAWVALGVWLYLRRAHIIDALTGKEPRGDALLRALGIRTHKTPRRAKALPSQAQEP